uniref:Uncharacterized protein n=1 Tax=Romanomermis culicivorax TaxID=13658 RepID=A0A915L110_ROMCU
MLKARKKLESFNTFSNIFISLTCLTYRKFSALSTSTSDLSSNDRNFVLVDPASLTNAKIYITTNLMVIFSVYVVVVIKKIAGRFYGPKAAIVVTASLT